MPETAPAASLARHEADSVESLAAFHQEHYRGASALQTAIDRVTEQLGRPIVVVVILALLLAWTAYAVLTSRSIDSASLNWIEFAGTVGALVVAMLILVTQRREDQLADRQAKLTLEMAILADKKSSKIISLLEELRRDFPELANRVDPETEEMSKPADTGSVLEAIERTAEKPSR